MLEDETAYRCTWAPINHSLVFTVPPSPTLRYQRPSTSEARGPNREPHALEPGNTANVAYLENESRLYEILGALERRAACDFRDRLLVRVHEGLATMEHHKELEWNRQRTGSIARSHGYQVVDTGMYQYRSSLSYAQRTRNKVSISITRSLKTLSSPRPSSPSSSFTFFFVRPDVQLRL